MHVPWPEVEMLLFARNALDALERGVAPVSPAIMASLLVSKIVLFSAITSKDPYIQVHSIRRLDQCRCCYLRIAGEHSNTTSTSSS